ncbi:MAG: hypothetical protein H7Y42_04900 [Chitinophagaceae bacterium]|nr:hypothetical protein [Chitinophagaceae bacterium]
MSNVFAKIADLESQPLSQIIYNLIKWYNVDNITSEFYHRPQVESSVWIQLKITKDDKTWYVDGQRNDIVKRRLIEWFNRYVSPPQPPTQSEEKEPYEN